MCLQDFIKRFDDYRVHELPRLQRLFDYYIGKHDILDKKNRLETKADARVVSGYANYISTIATAYFLGKNISYKAEENNQEFEKLKEYLATEEEQKCNFELALNCSIFGKAYELLYIDEFQELKQKCLDTRDVFVIRDNTIDRNIIGAIRFDVEEITKSERKVTLEVYDNRTITTYSYIVSDGWSVKELSNAGEPIGTRLHGFNRVPIIEYLNNKVHKGDFENVISYIDAYNTAVSTSIDDLTDFSDAYLVMENMQGTTDEDIEGINKNKIILTSEDGKVYWLIKQVNDTYSQNVKDRINDDIHKFSFTPDMGDEKFSGNTSGVALEFKLLPLEQLGAQKEMYFKDSLNKRLQIMIEHLNLNIKPRELQKVFTRNLPRNLKEISEIMKNLKGLVSDETLISLFPSVEDARVEIEKIKTEAEENNIYNDYEILNKKVDDKDDNQEK